MLEPCLQSPSPFGWALNRPILKNRPETFSLVCHLPQPGKLLLQCVELLAFFHRHVLEVLDPQPATSFQAASLLGRHLTLQLPAGFCQALLKVLHDMEAVNGDGHAVPKCFPNCGLVGG